MLIAENTISGFGKAFTFSDNVWNTDFDHDTVNNNGQNLYFPDGTVNSGENIEINGGSWSNDYSPSVNPFQLRCIQDASNAVTSIYFIGVSTDLCQVCDHRNFGNSECVYHRWLRRESRKRNAGLRFLDCRGTHSRDRQQQSHSHRCHRLSRREFQFHQTK